MTERPDDPTTREIAASPARRRSARAGLLYGLGAYSMWGVFPLYFHALAEVAPWIILCHRIVWSVLFLGLVVSIRGEWHAIRPILRSRRNILLLTAGSILIALNWLIFIYAVVSRQVVETSLGYFINPLLSVALGVIFLRERLRRLAMAGRSDRRRRRRQPGVARHRLSLDRGFPRLHLWFLWPGAQEGGHQLAARPAGRNCPSLPSGAGAAWRSSPPRRHLRAALGILSLSGVITAVPLLMFGAALRRLNLSTIGFLQYIGPTGQLLVALVVFHEPLDHVKLTSFALCWLGIAVYTADSVLTRQPQAVADEPE